MSHPISILIAHPRAFGGRTAERCNGDANVEPAPAIVEALRDGLLDQSMDVTKVRAVSVAPERRNNRSWPELLVAAQVDPGDGSEPLEGVWATGALGGPIYAINAVARECSSWGSAARGGSQADEMRNRISTFPEVEGSLRVLRGT